MSEHQQHHLERLLKEHRQLDKQIDQMEFSGVFEDTRLEQLKKMRLHVRDEIARLEHEIKAKK